jgi:ABC-2 type transport system permease protein
MIHRIFLNEWKSFRSDGTSLLLVAIITACSAYGLYNGMIWAKRHERVWLEASPKAAADVAMWKARFESGGGAKSPYNNLPEAADPYYLSSQLQDVVMPPAALAPLSVGQSDLYPVHTTVRAWSGADSLFSKSELENPSNLLAGRFDLAFVIVYLYPLLILAVSYNLVSGEKEQGTLALLLSQPISIATVLASKVVFRLLVACVPIIVTTLLVLQRGLWTFSLAVVLYGLLWLNMAALVNLWDRGSAAHVMILAGFWLIFVVVLPSLIGSAAGFLYPIPPRGQIIIAYQDAEPDTRRDGPAALANYYEEHPDMKPEKNEPEITEFRRQLLAVSLSNNKLVAPVVERYDRQQQGQRTLVSQLKFISPAAVMQELLNDLAGTGFMRHQHFRDHVNEFIREQGTFFFPKIFRSEPLTLDDYESMPVYRYKDEPPEIVNSRVATAVGTIAVFNLGIFVVAYFRLRRFEVSR